MNCKTPMPMTEFDMATLDDSTQMMKAIIPYIGFPMQKSMAIMIRIKELTDTIKCYSKGPVFPDRSSAGQAEILSSLGQCLPPDLQNSINMMSQMMQFSNAMNLYKDMEQSPEFMNIMNMMNGMNSETPPAPADVSNSTNFSSTSNTPQTSNAANMANSFPTDNSSPDAMLQGMMNEEQMEMYNGYLNEIDEIFSRTENIQTSENIPGSENVQDLEMEE